MLIYVLLADGFEEIEAVAVIDILRRADLNVSVVGVGDDNVKGTNGITIKTDCKLNEVSFNDIGGVILPGGMPGTSNLSDNELVCNLIRNVNAKNKLIGAICAAPSVLGKLGILVGRSACCYPGFEQSLDGANVVNKRVCVDQNVVTARGPGVAVEFGLELVGILCGNDKKFQIRESMQC